MDNQTIYNAAHIISSVGKQINSMFDHIEELVEEHADNSPFKSVRHNQSTDKYDSSKWLAVSQTYNYGIIERRNTKRETIQMGFQVVIYDEDEGNAVVNWQPTLRVLIEAGGIGPWDSECFPLHTAMKEGYGLVASNKLWTWDDKEARGCIYMLPLAAIANREFLETNIVMPAIKLAGQLADGAAVDTLVPPPTACEFSYDGDELSFKS